MTEPVQSSLPAGQRYRTLLALVGLTPWSPSRVGSGRDLWICGNYPDCDKCGPERKMEPMIGVEPTTY